MPPRGELHSASLAPSTALPKRPQGQRDAAYPGKDERCRLVLYPVPYLKSPELRRSSSRGTIAIHAMFSSDAINEVSDG